MAGGETSGAVVQALGVKGLEIGPMIDPGVPATVSIGRTPPLALALKSGNFGGPDFFLRAFTRMPGHRERRDASVRRLAMPAQMVLAEMVAGIVPDRVRVVGLGPVVLDQQCGP